jgi:hypothetical protein
MGETRTDPLTLARIAAIAKRYTLTGTLTDEQRDQAVRELTDLAAGRTDLLAEHAGVALGLQDSRKGYEAAQYGLQAELCIGWCRREPAGPLARTGSRSGLPSQTDTSHLASNWPFLASPPNTCLRWSATESMLWDKRPPWGTE